MSSGSKQSAPQPAEQTASQGRHKGQGRSQPDHDHARRDRGGGKEACHKDGCPLLTYGADCNIIKFLTSFKPIFAAAYIEFYTVLERGVLEEIPTTAEVIEDADYNEEDDPLGLVKEEIKVLVRYYLQMKLDRKKKQPAAYEFVWAHLSKESQEALKLDASYDDFNRDKNVLELWMAILAVHSVSDPSRVPAVQKAKTRQVFNSTEQDQMSIVTYKELFDHNYANYVEHGNAELDGPDQAMAFFQGLDPNRYNVINRLNGGIMTQPENLNAMYRMAADYLVPSGSTTRHKSGSHAIFAVSADSNRQNRGGGGGRGREDGGRGGTGGR